ncbi:double-stranded rna-binding type zinc finger domain protein [Colletotrichum incanum]|uniref:Double-stranded rna-binding type zinc finger domain protein n=1 Tax=Colletotrichum incanum TaxID=1573173 RepID=A0A161VQY0_COLIC|nr:double-stranded rna-binding type zinc finger domain protein [Colletotrichum incanum]
MSSSCIPCNRPFGSEEALHQHLRDSPVHAPSFDCETCNRPFGSEEALQQHLRDSPAHQQNTRTPLDAFFRSYLTFDYDPSLAPTDSYANLQKHKGWHRDQTESTDAWNRYQNALEKEFKMWYGAEDDLAAWHALCRAIGIKPLPETCEQCEKAARRTHVNIVDLIECRRGNKGRVQTFRNVEELRTYTRMTGKVFRNRFNQEDGNVVLRHLLRNIFRESL